MSDAPTTARQATEDPAVCGFMTMDFRGKPLAEAMRELERTYIAYALTQADGNKTKAAQIAGQTKDAFHRRCRLYSIRSVYRCV